MTLSELPEPYKSLAIQRISECATGVMSDFLSTAFIWDETEEGVDFWVKVHCAKTIDQLPPIPKKENETLIILPRDTEKLKLMLIENYKKGNDGKRQNCLGSIEKNIEEIFDGLFEN
jgi:hypothetical protein